MKKILFILFFICAWSIQAQNIQLHYDFGRNIYSNQEVLRPKVTATFELFKADKIGSWFYFIDLDINSKGVYGAYTEVSREFNIGKKGFAAHIEYDGGLNKGGTFQSAALFGPAWNGHNKDFSTTYSVQLLYKPYFNSYSGRGFQSFQLTGIWSTTFAKKKCTFAGFIDFWRGEKANGHGMMVWISEPQFWYNVNSHFSAGTEVELSNNFIYNTFDDKTFFVNPTVGLKYNF